MPLYSYKKAPIRIKSNEGPKPYVFETYVEPPKKRQQLTVGELLVGAGNDFHKLMSTSRLAALVIPTILVVTGISIIYNQVWPTFTQTLKQELKFFQSDATALVAGEYIQAEQRYSNPGSKYFADLKATAQQKNLLFSDQKSGNYKGTFSLSIHNLGLNNIKVTANVDSGVEEIYDNMLKDGLAHFQGTNLPFSESATSNVVIYGHSSGGDYYERTKDPAAAFSRLNNIKYGDEIKVDFDGKEYKYKTVKVAVVKGDNLSILEGKPGQKQLVLFTCYPNGNNENRFVATAMLVE